MPSGSFAIHAWAGPETAAPSPTIVANTKRMSRRAPSALGTRNPSRARKAGWQMLPSHDARLRQHVWYLRVGAPRSERHLSVEPPENGRQA